MESRRVPALIALAGVVVAVALFFLLKDDTADDEATVPPTTTEQAGTGSDGASDGGGGAGKPEGKKPDEPKVPVIEIEAGQPVGGVAEIEVAKGDSIRFVVESDVDEEVHLHGYDVSQDVAAGGRVEFDVPATAEGVFEVELEHSVVPIAEISVVPG
jgi:hypothetical protein